jgi:hypothetical protein
MSDIKYHIFKVNSYKGGELRTYVNLSKERFIDIILDNYICYSICIMIFHIINSFSLRHFISL